MTPLTCVATSWLFVTVTAAWPAPVIPAHWNRIESGPDSVAVAEFARFVTGLPLDGIVESSTTTGALSVTNWQGLFNSPPSQAKSVFAVITYDPDGNDTDKMVTNCGLAPCPGIVTPEQDGNKHEAEYA